MQKYPIVRICLPSAWRKCEIIGKCWKTSWGQYAKGSKARCAQSSTNTSLAFSERLSGYSKQRIVLLKQPRRGKGRRHRSIERILEPSRLLTKTLDESTACEPYARPNRSFLGFFKELSAPGGFFPFADETRFLAARSQVGVCDNAQKRWPRVGYAISCLCVWLPRGACRKLAGRRLDK